MNKVAMLALAVIGLSAPAEAKHCGQWSVNKQQVSQQQRIYQGYRSGYITPKEAALLRKRQQQIAALEARMRVNGLSYRERVKLNQQLSLLNRQIYLQRHDNQVRI